MCIGTHLKTLHVSPNGLSIAGLLVWLKNLLNVLYIKSFKIIHENIRHMLINYLR